MNHYYERGSKYLLPPNEAAAIAGMVGKQPVKDIAITLGYELNAFYRLLKTNKISLPKTARVKLPAGVVKGSLRLVDNKNILFHEERFETAVGLRSKMARLSDRHYRKLITGEWSFSVLMDPHEEKITYKHIPA